MKGEIQRKAREKQLNACNLMGTDLINMDSFTDKNIQMPQYLLLDSVFRSLIQKSS